MSINPYWDSNDKTFMIKFTKFQTQDQKKFIVLEQSIILAELLGDKLV